MTKALTVAALVCLSLTLANAQREPWPTGWAVAGEVGAGAAVGIAGLVVGEVGGFITSSLLHPGSNMDEPYHMAAIMIGGVCVGYPLGFATGTWALGSIGRQGGRFWGALLGSSIGAALPLTAYLVLPGLDVPHDDLLPTVIVGAMVACPPTGAIIGYNLTRPRDTEVGWLKQHVDMPRMAMTMSHDELNRPVAGVKCDLLSARF